MLGMNAGYLLLWPGLRGFGASHLPPVRLEVWGNPVPVLVYSSTFCRRLKSGWWPNQTVRISKVKFTDVSLTVQFYRHFRLID
jgi:hypothetical protein